MSFETSPLRPSPFDDAEQIVGLTNEDLRRAKLPEAVILANADPSNPEHVATQQNELEMNPDHYRVLHDGRAVIGAVKLAEWYTGDQWPYASLIERVSLIKRARLDEHRLKGNPLGIFALLVAENSGHDPSMAAETLLDDVLEGVEAEVRMGIHEDDPLKYLLLEKYKFEPTGKHGKILGSPITQELHIRKRQD